MGTGRFELPDSTSIGSECVWLDPRTRQGFSLTAGPLRKRVATHRRIAYIKEPLPSCRRKCSGPARHAYPDNRRLSETVGI